MSEQKKWQGDETRSTITGRPNIDDISKRNEEEARQERKSNYTMAGIIALLIIAAIFFVYFLS